MKLVTILESDESAKTAYVQINDDTLIGTGAAGSNASHQFSDAKGADEPWKGTCKDSVAAFYPGAELHTADTLNTKVEGILLGKGLRVKLDDGSLVTPEEKARLDQLAADAAKAEADRLAAVAAQEAVDKAALAEAATDQIAAAPKA